MGQSKFAFAPVSKTARLASFSGETSARNAAEIEKDPLQSASLPSRRASDARSRTVRSLKDIEEFGCLEGKLGGGKEGTAPVLRRAPRGQRGNKWSSLSQKYQRLRSPVRGLKPFNLPLPPPCHRSSFLPLAPFPQFPNCSWRRGEPTELQNPSPRRKTASRYYPPRHTAHPAFHCRPSVQIFVAQAVQPQ